MSKITVSKVDRERGIITLTSGESLQTQPESAAFAQVFGDAVSEIVGSQAMRSARPTFAGKLATAEALLAATDRLSCDCGHRRRDHDCDHDCEKCGCTGFNPDASQTSAGRAREGGQ